jgi:hypothetical protein
MGTPGGVKEGWLMVDEEMRRFDEYRYRFLLEKHQGGKLQ